jgi:hypothetical protein
MCFNIDVKRTYLEHVIPSRFVCSTSQVLSDPMEACTIPYRGSGPRSYQLLPLK